MKDETGIWVRYAAENLESARVLLERNLYNPCLQNLQQAIEKYLKALLVKEGGKLRRTHSISELDMMLREIPLQTGLAEEECELLDSIYLPSKYPLGSALPEFEPNDDLCRRCLAIAEQVERKVRAQLLKQ